MSLHQFDLLLWTDSWGFISLQFWRRPSGNPLAVHFEVMQLPYVGPCYTVSTWMGNGLRAGG